MSHYGPPGRPDPGQPQEPWQGRGQDDPYQQSPQRWGAQNPWNDPPYARQGSGGSESTQVYEQLYPPPAEWSDPPPPAPGGPASRMPMLVLAVVLALLVCGGGTTALYLLGRGEEPTNAEPSPQAAKPTATQASRPAGGPASRTPTAQSSTDARFVKVGQCVKNDGASTAPKLVITKCAADTYQVLARIDGATTGERDAKAKCSKVEGYTDWYFFNSELDVLDFVLCLKLR
jgi:hypothetical protein